MEKFFEWEYRFMMFLQNSIRGPLQNKVMWCITSLENAGFLSIAACLALLLQPKWRRGGRGGHRVHDSGISGGQSAFEKLGSQSAALSSSGGSDSSGAGTGRLFLPVGTHGAAFAVASVMFLGMPHSIGVPALIVASLIGFSRIYLGVHFPTDVLGGVVKSDARPDLWPGN